MKTIRNQEFRNLDDYGTGRVVENLRFEMCEFYSCRFSTTSDIDKRSIARNVDFVNCSVIHSSIDSAILENIHINGLEVYEIFFLWDPLFKHVVLEGDIGTLKINNIISSVDWDPEIQRPFDLAKEAYYQEVDWALDISQARLSSEFDMRGIPANLVRIDPETQGFVTRESALQEGWRDRVRNQSEEDIWVFAIDMFLQDGDADLVLAVPKGTPRKSFREELDALNELKDLGVVLNSV